MSNESSTRASFQFNFSTGFFSHEGFSSRPCILQTEEEPNDVIEGLYGPFAVPNVFIGQKSLSALEEQQLKIMQLKKDIEEKERMQSNLLRLKKDATFTSVPNAIPSEPIETRPLPVKRLIVPIESVEKPLMEPVIELAVKDIEPVPKTRVKPKAQPEPTSESQTEPALDQAREEIVISDDDEPLPPPGIDPDLMAEIKHTLAALERDMVQTSVLLEENKRKSDSVRIDLLQIKVKMSIRRNQGAPKRHKRSNKLARTSPPQKPESLSMEDVLFKPGLVSSQAPAGSQQEIYPFSNTQFHQQLPYAPPTLFYRPVLNMDRLISPPPPPASPPPPSPPPPPPAEERRKYRVLEHDGLMMSSVLNEIQLLVSLRISNITDPLEKQKDRPLPNTPLLTTLDRYTLWDVMPLTHQNNESPLFALLSRKAMGWEFDEPMESFANDLLSHIPSDIDLCQQDNQFPTKMKAVLEFVRRAPGAMNDAKQSLWVELHYLVYGAWEGQEEEGEMVCLDVLWQHVRFDPQPALEAISGLLRQLGQARTDQESSQRVSRWNLEVLIRSLLYEDGYSFVLNKLTADPNVETKGEERLQTFTLDESRVYLTEQDKYTMWMIVLYYFVTRRLPDPVCQGWMDTLIKTGQAKTEKPLFVIDWRPMLENRPFSKQGQMACANILLSMLNHFGKKACHDPSRTPLLVGVLQTLFNFLSFSPSYKVAGALILARKVSGLTSLQPEMQMIELDLERKAGRKKNRAWIQTVMKEKNIERRLVIGFYLVSRLPAEEREDLRTMAGVLGACVGCFASNNDSLVLGVDKIRQSYLHQLELDVLNVHSKKSNTRQIKSCSFAWLNLLVLLQISKLLYNENSVVRDTLISQMDLVLDGARKSIKSEHEITFIQDYVSQLKKS